MKILCLIPARAGSKRVKDKNSRNLAGIPLIAHTIEAAKGSKYITRVLVSTDSPEIVRISQQYGVKVPFLRPAELASDNSTEFEFHGHALEWLKVNEGYEPDIIVNLYPTTPFRSTASIDSAIEKIMGCPDADSLRSVKKCTEHPYKMWFVEGSYLQPFVNTEDTGMHASAYHLLPAVFVQNASIYITKPATIKAYGNTIGKKVLSFVMNDHESIDINNEMDFLLAEHIVEQSERIPHA